MSHEMDQEDGNAQVVYPRILPEQMAQFRGRRVTLMGSICDTDKNSSLVIDCGQNNKITVDNLRRADINEKANLINLIEVRGTVMSNNMISSIEFTEFSQKEEFDFETYAKFVNLSFNDKLRQLFQDS